MVDEVGDVEEPGRDEVAADGPPEPVGVPSVGVPSVGSEGFVAARMVFGLFFLGPAAPEKGFGTQHPGQDGASGRDPGPMAQEDDETPMHGHREGHSVSGGGVQSVFEQERESAGGEVGHGEEDEGRDGRGSGMGLGGCGVVVAGGSRPGWFVFRRAIAARSQSPRGFGLRGIRPQRRHRRREGRRGRLSVRCCGFHVTDGRPPQPHQPREGRHARQAVQSDALEPSLLVGDQLEGEGYAVLGQDSQMEDVEGQSDEELGARPEGDEAGGHPGEGPGGSLLVGWGWRRCGSGW